MYKGNRWSMIKKPHLSKRRDVLLEPTHGIDTLWPPLPAGKTWGKSPRWAHSLSFRAISMTCLPIWWLMAGPLTSALVLPRDNWELG